MKLIDYIFVILLFGALLTGMLMLPFLVDLRGLHINATRYMSIGGKVALLLLTAGMFFFLIKFFIPQDTK